MKRWNDYYESMEPRNRKANKAQVQTPLSQVRSVFPRKSNANISGAPTITNTNNSHHPNPSIATAETSFGRYIQRRSNADQNARQTTEGNTNFAWID